jgi:hypothetical protein
MAWIGSEVILAKCAHSSSRLEQSAEVQEVRKRSR